jgi:DNA-binding NarL/FixJ family response regulator
LAQGLFKAKAERYDLYLIDEVLPDGSGADLTLQIRDFDKTTPIIIHSAHGHAPVIEKAIKAGAQEFLQKQGDMDGLVRTIQAHLGIESKGDS